MGEEVSAYRILSESLPRLHFHVWTGAHAEIF